MKKIKIAGYKAINKEKEIKFAPITLLVGPNGSGKSTMINALLLSKGILDVKHKIIAEPIHIFGEDYSKNDYDDDRLKLFSKLSGDIEVQRRLLNSFNDNGKFPDSIINKHCKSNSFIITLPLALQYFPDEFDISFKYELDKQNNATVSSITINNITLKKELASFSIEEYLVDPDVEIIIQNNSEIRRNNIKDVLIKIDIDYVLKFIELLRSQPIPEYIRADYQDDDYFETIARMEEESRKERKAFRDKLFTEFSSTQSCYFETKFSSKYNPPVYLLEMFSKWLDLDFFLYKKDDMDDYNIKIDKPKYVIAKIMENEFIENLKKGIRFTFNKLGVEKVFNTCIKDGFSYFIEQYFSRPGLNKLKMFNISFSPSQKTDLLLSQLILKNIGNSLIDLNKKIGDIIYIPPNRFVNYNNLLSSKNDLYNLIKNKIDKMQFERKYFEPVEFFSNYWLKEFNLKNKISFKSIDDVVSMFLPNEINFSAKQDLGYGLSQLIPVVCLVSLFNDKGDFHEYKNQLGEKELYASGVNNLFLIEEPEANLHPSFQSKLADLFIDAAWKFGHKFLIETHSEYLVRKLQYWVAKGKIKPEDVNIYYFVNKNDDKRVKDIKIKKIEILKDGGLSEPFGEGFFDEATNLQFELLKINNIGKN